MGKVKVYQYKILETDTVERRKARRWGTREAIEALKDLAEIIESSGVLVDETAVNRSGFTALDFDQIANSQAAQASPVRWSKGCPTARQVAAWTSVCTSVVPCLIQVKRDKLARAPHSRASCRRRPRGKR